MATVEMARASIAVHPALPRARSNAAAELFETGADQLPEVLAPAIVSPPADELLAVLGGPRQRFVDHARARFWWRTHQAVMLIIYFLLAAAAWQMTEWQRAPILLGVFLAVAALASALAIGLTIGIGLATLTIEPPTTRAAFGKD